ncbi:hypothetical protein [Thermus neutrinimicus]|uniref:hypothetical protein n=1 Tax=Thermus neutrinimicus TaxID=2908149 RepID=UPI001FAB14C8|nr:hypothetical protein [Thermus neutrinimicus]
MRVHLGLESLQAYPFPTRKGRALKGISARGKALGATPAASCPCQDTSLDLEATHPAPD